MQTTPQAPRRAASCQTQPRQTASASSGTLAQCHNQTLHTPFPPALRHCAHRTCTPGARGLRLRSGLPHLSLIARLCNRPLRRASQTSLATAQPRLYSALYSSVRCGRWPPESSEAIAACHSPCIYILRFVAAPPASVWSKASARLPEHHGFDSRVTSLSQFLFCEMVISHIYIFAPVIFSVH